MLSEKGYLDSSVVHSITPVTSGTKTVNLTFTISEGPKYKIKKIDFVGNKQVSDGKLRKQMKDIKAMSWLSWITQKGTYKEDKYAEDAEKVVAYYRDNGYLRVRVDNPEVKTLENSKDGKKRYVELRIPVTEGPRYKVGDVKVVDNKVVKAEALVQVFALKPGAYYSEKRVKKGMEKAREIYGSIGYFEFTAFPDFSFRDLPKDAQPRNMEEAQRATAVAEAGKPGPAIVDVTMHMQEGEQYFVNRITFLGNSTTHDNVIRREMQLVESGVFNTEALKQSVKHLNQLGYFKALEGNENVQVDKTPGEKNKVDIALKLEEQNRNQLTFGAGVSQFEGAFAQFSFQTSNFLGKGETLSLSVLTGKRYKDYQLSFSEPYLFDRPITGGINVFNRTINYIGAFTQESTGGNVMTGFRLASFTRAFMSYSYERVGISNLNPAYTDPELANTQPVPGRRAAPRHERQADHQQGLAELRAQHGRQPDLPDLRAAVHVQLRPRRPRRQHQLLQAARRGHPLLPADAQAVGRRPGPVRVRRPVARQPVRADLRAAGPGRRVLGPRLRHPHHRPARQHHGAGHRRQQEPAVQRRVRLPDRRAGARAGLLRRRAGPPDRPEVPRRTPSSPRRAPRSGSSCRCSTCPSA